MSSSTFVAESSEDKDDQLIIIVNADGTITVDPETLEKLMVNQQINTKDNRDKLSVVRVADGNPSDDAHDDEDGGSGPHINLTVEGFYTGNEPDILPTDGVDANSEVVDPFSQMEPEQIARLESVLQSEQAKEILGTNLGDNLNSMLDILETKEEAPRSVVHNDHSYTTTLPVYQQPPPQPQIIQPPIQPVLQQHRPLTRGGRGRGRGRGVLTRGGSRGAAPMLVTVSSAPTVILSPAKTIQTSAPKTFIVQAPPRVVAQPVVTEAIAAEEVVHSPPTAVASPIPTVVMTQPQTPNTPRLLQRKIIAKASPQLQTQQPQQHQQPQLKQQTLHQAILKSPQVPPPTPIVPPQESPISTAGINRRGQSVIVQKKTSPQRGRGRGGRGSRGGRRSQPSPTTPAVTPPPATGDEVSAALQAMELSPPPEASPPPVVTPSKVEATEPVIVARKKTPTVIIRKLSTNKSEVISPSGKASKVRHHQEDNEDFAPPVLQQQSPKVSVKQPKTPETPTSSRIVPAKEVTPAHTEETPTVKKKKEKKNALTPLVVEGPELFSTPDIIRRVSTDKPVEVPPPTPPVQVEPKVQVQPTHPPFKPTTANYEMEMTPESLLDSIHAEVAKDDSRLLAEALLLDDLTNDDSQSMTYPGKEKPEEVKPAPQPMESQPPLTKPVESPSQTQTPKVRKLPPIELPTTRSASKKAAATSQATSSAQPSVNTPVTPLTSGEKEKKRGAAGVVSEKRQSNETRKVPEKKYSLKEDFVSDFEDEELETDEESVNSEDDPNRLWCICKKPHNNRFMICCDQCEEWFHGKCVGVTKAMGHQMEKEGTEWSCPNCKAKDEAKQGKVQETAKSVSKIPSGQQTISSLQCITCKKPARVGSNYCNDMCVKKHAVNMIAVLNTEITGLLPSTRVIVYEKKSGNVISDNTAPTVSNLADWLLENQSFEVHQPSISNKVYKKLTATKPEAPPTPVNKKQTKSQQDVKPSPAAVKQVQNEKSKVSQDHGKQIQDQGKQTQDHAKQTPQAATPKQQQQPSAKTPVLVLKQNEKSGNLKQTILTQKTGSKEMIYTLKSPPIQKTIQLIQAQPLPPPVQTPKGKAREAKKEEEEEPKPKRATKTNEKVHQEVISTKRSSLDGKKPTVEKVTVKEEKRRDSTTTKETKEKEVEKKKDKEEKKKEKKKEPAESAKSEEPSAVSSTEPIRANVKRTIQELLNQRVKQDDSISITNEEIKELAIAIEEEMFLYFKDTGTKYKAKYRSLVFNIKDAKNLTLYKKIVQKSISPNQLVRMSPEELASQELAQWREKEAKHQLEIIKKNELDLIQQSKTVVLKSRKGEEVIEAKTVNISEIESALNRTADDYELENIETKEEEKSIVPDKKHDKKKEEHVSRSERRKSSSKEDRKKDRSRSRSRKRSRSKSRERDKRKKDKEKDNKDKERDKLVDKAEETLKEIEEVISQHISVTPVADSDHSDREPSSTVTIVTPPPAEEEKPAIWQGFLNMSEVTKLYTSAFEVSGSCEDLGEELSDQLECVGRIQPDSVWEYVSRMKKAGTKDIVVIRFHAEGVEEKMNYLSLYSYLNSRNRMAVIGSISKTVKDFYVLPLASHSPIPQVLLPLDGPGFEDYRPHLLLGIIIRTKKGMGQTPVVAVPNRNKKPSGVSSTTNNLNERSYTPPLPDSGFADSNYNDGDLPDSGSTTPPLPPYAKTDLTPPLPDEDEPYSPGEPYSPEDSQTEAILVNPDIQRTIQDVSRQIDLKLKQIKHIEAAVHGSTSVDEDTPYSPSSSMSPPNQEIPFLGSNEIKLPPNLQDILASIKGTPTMDVKSDPIVKAYTSQALYYDDEEDTRDDERDMRNERANRDPRQRPEPKSKSSLSQFSDSELLRKAAEMEIEDTTESFKQPYFFPPPPVVAQPPPPIFGPPPPPHYKYGPPPPPLPPPPLPIEDRREDRKRKDKFKDRRPPALPPPPVPSHTPRRKWEEGNHRRGMMTPHRPPMRGRSPRFRGNFDRGRGGGSGFRRGFRHHRGGGPGPVGPHPPHFPRGPNRNDRTVQSEWDEEIRNFERNKARERKRKISRSPSPRRRSVSPPRRRSRRGSTSS